MLQMGTTEEEEIQANEDLQKYYELWISNP
jgi:hypothetical protein